MRSGPSLRNQDTQQRHVAILPFRRNSLLALCSTLQSSVVCGIRQSRCVHRCNGEVNSCKAPSQEYVADTFGTPVHIQPNYDDFSCVWKFGVQPPPLAEDEAVRGVEWNMSTLGNATAMQDS